MAKGPAFRFEPNRQAAKQLASDTRMRRLMAEVSDDAAGAVESAAPRIVKHKGSRIHSDTERGTSGWEGRVIVRSPFWHFPEFGHSRYAARPFIRPNVQKVISRYGGRFKSQ